MTWLDIWRFAGALLVAGCGAESLPRFQGTDPESGRKIVIAPGPMLEGHGFSGRYSSPQLGEVVLSADKRTLVGDYRYKVGATVILGRMNGTVEGNLARYRFSEQREGCSRCVSWKGRGFFYFDPPALSERPIWLFGERSYERTLGRYDPRPRVYGRRAVTAVRTGAPLPAIAADTDETMAPAQSAAPPAVACAANPSARRACRRFVRPAASAPENQARLDDAARAIAQARRVAETRCDPDAGCERAHPPWLAVFVALSDAEVWLLTAQAAADSFGDGDGRRLDLARPCLSARLAALSDALRATGEPGVPGLDLLDSGASLPGYSERCVLAGGRR